VAPSTLCSIIGFDGEDFLLKMDGKLEGKVIPLYFGKAKGDFSLGVREALKILCNKIVEPPKEKKYMTYNIIGFTPDYYNFNSDLLEIEEIMLQGFGM
ncbi:MAG TPA: oxalate:formate antiporter, partial [Clostridium sp.]|nr:oxalate:formate antiporter [Clostridium sp.]